MHRLSNRSRIAPGLLSVALLVGVMTSAGIPHATAQVAPKLDASIMLEGPIRSLDPGSVPVELIRVFLTLESQAGSSRGTASIWAASEPDSVLVLNVADLEITEVLLPEYDVDAVWSVERGKLIIRVPDEALGSFRVDVAYRIKSALRSLSDDDDRLALWTSSLPGRASWMPLPSDEISAADYHLSVAAPRGWSIVVSGDGSAESSLEIDDRQVVNTSFDTTFPRSVGFLTWSQDSGIELASGSSAEILNGLGLDMDWLSTILSGTSDEAYTLLTTDSETIPAAFSGWGVRTTGRLNREDGWMRQYERLWRDYQLALTPTLGRLAPTDYWIDTALSAWMAIEHLRRTEGDAAAGLVLDELRRRYLSESTQYVRPLVWDRWFVASDLRDRHAEAKGAWVFRMLHERLGPDAFYEGLRKFLVEAQTEVVDSETLRAQLEVVSREDLGDFFDTWVYAAGHPIISLSYEYDPQGEHTNLELIQHQDGPLVPETFVFDAAFQYSTLAETNSVTLRVDQRERKTQLPTGIAPRFIHPDALATVPLDFQIRPEESDLVSQLRFSMDAASTIRSLHLLSGSPLDPTLLLGLRGVISATTDPAILAETAPILGSMAPSSSALTMLISWTSHEDARVRAAAVTALSSFSDSPEAYDAALAVANAGSDAHELAAAVKTLVTLRPGSAWPVLRAALVTSSEGELVRIQALELVGPDTADEDDVADAVLPLLDGSPDVAAAALQCLARMFPEGPRTTRTADAWLTHPSSILRAAALATIADRDAEDIPQGRLEAALAEEPEIDLRRQMQALLDRLSDDS